MLSLLIVRQPPAVASLFATGQPNPGEAMVTCHTGEDGVRPYAIQQPGCSPCTDCSTTDAPHEGRKCDSMKDTVCCPLSGMTVVDEPGGPVCEIVVSVEREIESSNKVHHSSATTSSSGRRSNMPEISPPGCVVERYNMNHPKRGTAIIINNKKFDDPMKNRKGTDVDADKMKRLLTEMGFEDVRVRSDLTAKAMSDELREVSEEDHSQSDSLVVVILSHGTEGGYVNGVDKNKVLLYDLVSYFNGNNCPSLAGKPKLFFIQACRGNKKDTGVTVTDGIEDDKNDKVEKLIPSDADIFIAYSVVPGFVSWRHPTQGSWFIQAVSDVFTKYWSNTELMHMMTAVNNKLAYDFEHAVKGNKVKQMSCIHSTFTKLLFFTKKERDEEVKM